MTTFLAFSELLEILSYRRPYGSYSTRTMERNHIVSLGAKYDRFGNLRLQVGSSPSVLWSAHTDSVHNMPGQQRIQIMASGSVCLKPNRKGKLSNCLGADDAVGVWLLCEMVRAGVPGLYIWHCGEERGGIGSGQLARQDPDVLKNIQTAIAFDRRGTDHIITHQSWSRCCSDDFAVSLANQLNRHGQLDYRANDGGTFTDTANYTRLIPECTNVSVGYQFEHSSAENLDLHHVGRLRDALCQIDATQFVVSRDPAVIDDDDMLYSYGEYYSRRDQPPTKVLWPKLSGTFKDHHSRLPLQDLTWCRVEGDFEYHLLDTCSLRSGEAACGARCDDPISYWSQESAVTPFFCHDCLDIDELDYNLLNAETDARIVAARESDV